MKKFMAMAAALACVAVFQVQTVRADAWNSRPAPIAPASGLQAALDAITVSGGIDVTADQDPFALFTNDASGAAVASFIIEITTPAGSGSGTSEFGLYDGRTGAKALIFDGSDAPGDLKFVTFFASGDIMITGMSGSVLHSGFSTDPVFGFYVDVMDVNGGLAHTVYTEDSMNGGTAQALVYQGDNTTELAVPGLASGVFTDNEFIFAFEESLLGVGGVGDYSDLVVLVESITPIPAPGAFLLGGLGLGLVGWLRRRHA